MTTIRTRKQKFKAAHLVIGRVGGCRAGVARGRKFLREAQANGLDLLDALKEARTQYEQDSSPNSDYFHLLTRLFPQVFKVDPSNVQTALVASGLHLTSAQSRMLRTRLKTVDAVTEEILRRARLVYAGRKGAKTRAAKRAAR